MIEDKLRNYFPNGYWDNFKQEFEHNFFEAHINRTESYSSIYDQFAGKSVLEIGGFPGLEVALLLEKDCQITCIDSPKYRPQYYLDWLAEHNLESIEHDIVSGKLDSNKFYDVAIMSDVLLHIDGFPKEFIRWCTVYCDKFVMINYHNENQSPLKDATNHSLSNGFPLPSEQNIISFFNECNADLQHKEQISSPDGLRDVLIFDCL